MTRTLFLLACTLVLCGACVTESYIALRPDASRVKAVRETDKPLRCAPLGDVHGTSRSQDEARAREGALNQARNEAARYKGATHVLIEIDRVKSVGTSPYREIFVAGKALRCDEG
jgi:hypothetical protein